MKKTAFAFLSLCLTISAVAQQPAAKPAESKPAAKTSAGANLPSEQTVEQFMRHTFGYDQNLKWRVVDIKPAADPAMTEINVAVSTPEGQQMLKLFVTPDQKFAISGEFVPFGSDPYGPIRNLLNEKAKGPWRGAANPEVTIVEFGDLQCPACKRAQPTIEKLMTEVPTARLVFQQYPLTSLHKWAETASKYALCVDRQSRDAFWKYIDTVYQHQDEMQQMTVEQVEPKLKEYAGEAGVNADKVQQCTADPAIAAEIYSSSALGSEVGVTGTPTLFIGGRKIGNVGGIPYETLKSITEFQAQNK